MQTSSPSDTAGQAMAETGDCVTVGSPTPPMLSDRCISSCRRTNFIKFLTGSIISVSLNHCPVRASIPCILISSIPIALYYRRSPPACLLYKALLEGSVGKDSRRDSHNPIKWVRNMALTSLWVASYSLKIRANDQLSKTTSWQPRANSSEHSCSSSSHFSGTR